MIQRINKFLYWLNLLLMVVAPYYWDELGIYKYISPNLLMLLTFIWGAVSMYFMMGRLPFFQKVKVRLIFIGSLMTFAVVVGLLVIYFVG